MQLKFMFVRCKFGAVLFILVLVTNRLVVKWRVASSIHSIRYIRHMYNSDFDF